MSNFQVTDSTVDVITRGLIKYRLVTHAAADSIGAEIKRINALALTFNADGEPIDGAEADASYPYSRRPFERKVKRTALDGAIRCWQYQVRNIDTDSMPVAQLVQRLYEKNLAKINGINPDYDPAAETADGYWDVDDTDEGRNSVMIRSREEREEENRARLAERMAALQAERAANPQGSDDESVDDEDDWDDDESYDDDDDES
jgi:hypothetical protein